MLKAKTPTRKKATLKVMSYEESKKWAQDSDVNVRRNLAARPDVKPEILYFLAEDSAPEVRQAIAANKSTPRQADVLLAADSHMSVRVGLAEKISRLAPGLTDFEQDQIHALTYEALEKLARDQAAQVRKVVAETLKDMVDAPPAVIQQLARDAELAVSGPVLEYSPVLNDADLLDIIAHDPIAGSLNAIANRQGVSAAVVDALVAEDDAMAIAQLLENPSAQIQEDTLDMILDRAPDHQPWHEPLVNRPELPEHAAPKLAGFVADNLLESLGKRTDLPPGALQAVKNEVQRRLGNGGPEAASPDNAAPEDLPAESQLKTVQIMEKDGTLGEQEITEAFEKGDYELLKAALSVKAQLPLEAIEAILISQSNKALVSLSWKAGFTMKQAVEVQKILGDLPPRKVLNPKKGGTYPLEEEEMDWQIKFFL
ncbi:MAG: DUF2336 domain-containing protein [Rhodospirillales bacterium]|nr:DUF2336 domain-containing protein [Rhodospirillales bacterium]